jgi:peroxiredoxin
VARVELDTPAPDFSLTDLDGNEVALSGFRGEKHVFVVFNRGFV